MGLGSLKKNKVTSKDKSQNKVQQDNGRGPVNLGKRRWTEPYKTILWAKDGKPEGNRLRRGQNWKSRGSD